MLVAYASKHESTHEVAEEVARVLREAGEHVEVRLARDVDAIGADEPVVLGAPLYMGRWHKDARHFLKRHRERLAGVPLAVFALGPLHDKEKEVAGSRQQLETALRKVPEVRPIAIEVFVGRIDPAQLRFPFSRMPASDERDWEAIQRWAESLPALLAARERKPVAVA
jgi:menaquinone-dependent protoporphyrinogen oxidase